MYVNSLVSVNFMTFYIFDLYLYLYICLFKLAEWWDNIAYLEYREPSALMFSPGYAARFNESIKTVDDQLRFATLVSRRNVSKYDNQAVDLVKRIMSYFFQLCLQGPCWSLALQRESRQVGQVGGKSRVQRYTCVFCKVKQAILK